jgi:hypothetical protein
MSQHDRDREDLLRRALHSAADPLEPSGDGLERIRARLTTPHAAPVAWILAACSGLARRVRGGLGSIGARLPVRPGPAWQRGRVTRPGPQRQWQPLRTNLAVALVVAACAVTIGVSAVTPPLRQAIAQTGSLIRSVGSRLSGSPGGVRLTGHGTLPFPGGGAAATVGTPNHRQPSGAGCGPQRPARAASSASPAVTTAPAPCAAPASGPGPATSPSPSLSAAPSASPALSATPSPSASPTLSATPSPSASPSPG